MKNYCFALAALAAIGFTGTALAQDGTRTTTTGPAAMSDAEMDRVTAGTGSPGFGNNTACSFANGTCLAPGVNNNRADPRGRTVNPGLGRATVDN